MCSVLTGHAGNQNAAKLTRAQKEEPKAILAQPPSQAGVHAEFWDVPAIRDVVKILFDVEYRSDSSYGCHETKSFLVSRSGRCSKS